MNSRAAFPFAPVAVGVAAVLAVALPARRALAVETRADVETDHVDAADDGGPRAVGVVVRPLSMARGWLGGEVDAACGEKVVVSVEGDGRAYGASGYRAALGASFFVQRFAFHGFYLHPTAQWAHAAVPGITATAIGGGVTLGYEWTWPVGATVRLGGGASYARALVNGAGRALGIEGVDPEVDGDVGWVF
jgi:hypothetical protein